MSQLGPLLGLVVVNFESHSLLVRNLVPMELDRVTSRIVVVDNYSTAEERARVSRACRDNAWELVERENVGFGAGVNAGVARLRELGCDVIVLLNPDAYASREVIEELAAHARAEPRTMVCPRIVTDTGAHWFAGGGLDLDTGRTTTAPGTDPEQEGGWLTGACLALSASLWDDLDGFDDDYFMYWEDVDLSWRCTGSGGRLAVRADLIVEHAVGGTQGQSGKSELYFFYNCRNRLIFAHKHLSISRRLQWTALSLDYARRVVLRGGRRALLRRPLPPVRAAASGTLRGAFNRSGRAG